MTTCIVDEYFEYYEKYSKEYGEKTCILMQIGSFYEMHELNCGNMSKVCELLDIQMTRKNKSIETISRSNPYLAGFPKHSISKFLPKLLDDGYTIILIDQEEGDYTGKKRRSVSGIYSPSIQPIEYSSGDGNILTSVYIELYETKNEISHVGFSIVNINTTTNTFETYEKGNSVNINKNNSFETILDDISRILIRYNSKEFIFCVINSFSDTVPLQFTKSFISEYFNIHDSYGGHGSNLQWSVIFKDDSGFKVCLKPEYQNEYLTSVYKHVNFGLLKPIEYFEMEVYQLTILNCINALQFISRHDIKYLSNIAIPKVLNEYEYLVLEMNTLQQLNILPSKINHHKFGSLFNVLNKTKTSIGKRYLKSLLGKPFKDTGIIKERYELSEQLELVLGLGVNLDVYLEKICDLERFHRKLGLCALHPFELYNLQETYDCIIELNNKLLSFDNFCISGNCIDSSNMDLLLECTKEYKNTFDIDELKKYNLNETSSSIENFFKIGIKELDEIKTSIINIEHKVEEYRLYLDTNSKSNCIKQQSGEWIKMSYTDQDGYFFTCTKNRFDSLQKALSEQNFSKLIVKKITNSCKITSLELQKLSEELVTFRECFLKKIKVYYLDYLQKSFIKYNSLFDILKTFIEIFDITQSNIKCKNMYNYCKPIVHYSENSFVECKKLRHPIIERINDSTEYIPNDISLNDSTIGMILYAMNSGGKSSLLRSIGLCVVMAQCGLYVPCSEMIFSPFDTIVTQVDLHDNLWKSQSSFVTEMIGLGKIAKLANNKNLLLADEMTKGTEVVSATSIFTASVIELLKRNCKFVFTTHLQDVAKLLNVESDGDSLFDREFFKDAKTDIKKSLEKLSICHLSVTCEESGNIIFDRKLQQGPCSELYGLEVAKAVGIDRNILDTAFEIRHELMHTIGDFTTRIKKSNYNNNKILSKCEICGYKPTKNTDIPLDTHHIKFQCTANDKNFIDHYHKNAKFNLVCLCKACHISVHNGSIIIEGYKQTTNGLILDFKYGTQN